MARTKDPDIYVATSTGTIKVDGVIYPYAKGRTRVRAGHALLKAAPGKFKPLDVHYDIEQATAAPGEQRGERRGSNNPEARNVPAEAPNAITTKDVPFDRPGTAAVVKKG